ncbi:Kinase superfamily protein [Hibiscus syriacus]|uniref:Kinase superfamily protein n=1 Tax=Hibiscus syriacus TaxID=106335 RepID=A0A6A2Y6V4_HIBSY|nr:Kinase superfamily protein [Hibiscus syriacus]
MRIHARLPKFLWAEAFNTAAYLINCGPSVPLDGEIPEEAWSKKEINLSHLRVFAASFVVQSVVDAGVSPFLITYICNSLFIVYIPLVEIGRYLEDNCGSLLFRRNSSSSPLEEMTESEQAILLGEGGLGSRADGSSQFSLAEEGEINHEILNGSLFEKVSDDLTTTLPSQGEVANVGLDAKGRWTRTRVAKVSLSVCPFWFLAQLAFDLSLKYTTVTSNTVLSSASSIFTFLVSLAVLGEKFSWIKLVSVLLCMTGTIIVSLGDSHNNKNLRIIASNPVLGDVLALVAAALYAVYVTLIRKKLPDNDEKSGRASMAQFLGLLDNVLNDYLWAKAVLLTTATVATAGLAIQVPLAAIVDMIIGNGPHLLDYLGAAAVMIGFAGMNIPTDVFCRAKEGTVELENGNISLTNQEHTPLPREETI